MYLGTSKLVNRHDIGNIFILIKRLLRLTDPFYHAGDIGSNRGDLSFHSFNQFQLGRMKGDSSNHTHLPHSTSIIIHVHPTSPFQHSLQLLLHSFNTTGKTRYLIVE